MAKRGLITDAFCDRAAEFKSIVAKLQKISKDLSTQRSGAEAGRLQQRLDVKIRKVDDLAAKTESVGQFVFRPPLGAAAKATRKR
jgi:hypothetical protein